MDPMTMIAGVVATVVIAGVMLVIAKFSFGGESEYEQQIARQKEILLNDEPKSKGAAEKKKPSKEKKKEKKGMLWLTRWSNHQWKPSENIAVIDEIMSDVGRLVTAVLCCFVVVGGGIHGNKLCYCLGMWEWIIIHSFTRSRLSLAAPVKRWHQLFH